LVAGDFVKTLAHVTKGDFVYLDPPYAVNSRRVFKQYGKKTFDVSDMPRFMAELNMIDVKGADYLVSYADCAESRLLASAWHSIRLPIRRHIAGFTDNRRIAYEWLISNRPVTALRRVTKHRAPQ
jgi:DNA adenine methylase